jgi:hypothetical protein
MMISMMNLMPGESERISSIVPMYSMITMIPRSEKRLALEKKTCEHTNETIIPKKTAIPPSTGTGYF